MIGLWSNNGQLWQSFVFGWYQQWADCFPLAVTLHDIVHTDKSLTLVFEYLERDLKQYMDDCGAILSMNNVKLFLYQVLYPHGSCSWYSSRVFHTLIQLWEGGRNILSFKSRHYSKELNWQIWFSNLQNNANRPSSAQTWTIKSYPTLHCDDRFVKKELAFRKPLCISWPCTNCNLISAGFGGFLQAVVRKGVDVGTTVTPKMFIESTKPWAGWLNVGTKMNKSGEMPKPDVS